MWNSFWHLIWRSLVYFPTSLSSNWLSICLPALVWMIMQGFRVRKSGWTALEWKTIGSDTVILAGVYVVLFGWAITHTVYQDHLALKAENSALQKALNR